MGENFVKNMGEQSMKKAWVETLYKETWVAKTS